MPDWLRMLDLDTDDDLDDDVCYDGVDDVLLVDDREASPMNPCTSSVGPGLSPGHSQM